MFLPESDELRDFIDGPLREKLTNMEKVQKQRRRRFWTLTILLSLILIPTSILSFLSNDATGLEAFFRPSIYLFALLTISGLFGLFLAKKKRPFYYHQDILAPLVQFLHPRLRYQENTSLSSTPWQNSPFIPDELSSFSVSHLCQGDLKLFSVTFGQSSPTHLSPMTLFSAELPSPIDRPEMEILIHHRPSSASQWNNISDAPLFFQGEQSSLPETYRDLLDSFIELSPDCPAWFRIKKTSFQATFPQEALFSTPQKDKTYSTDPLYRFATFWKLLVNITTLS